MTEEGVEFDNIDNVDNARRANVEVPEDEKNNKQLKRSGDGLFRFLSILPCVPAYQPKPETPNIDEVN